MKKTLMMVLFLSLGIADSALAADNVSPNDLQQLQALQQRSSSQFPARANVVVNTPYGQMAVSQNQNQNQINNATIAAAQNAVVNTPPAPPATPTPVPSATPTNLPPPSVPTAATNNVAVGNNPQAPVNNLVQAAIPVGVVQQPPNQPILPNAQVMPSNPPPPPGPAGQPQSCFNQQAAMAVQGGLQSPPLQAPFVPPGSPMGDTDASQGAFNSMVNTALPMTPDQIHRLKQLFTATQYAQAAPAGTPPRPVATSQMVNLAPGATPPVIRLAQGFVTSLVFIDSTGAPWPIEAYSIGDPSRFNIQWNKTDNTLMIQAMSLYNYGNLAVRLKGLVTPVMLTLIPGQKDVDYRVDLRVQGLGPNAQPLIGEVLPNSTNPILLGVLDGIPPPGSKELSVCGTDIQAWLLGNKLYLRSHFTILSPAWLATLSSADGTKAYEMQKTPMLLISLHGKAVPVKIEGL